MRNLLNFFLKYNYWFLFIFLEMISLVLLFRFNHYQGSAYFTTSNCLAGFVYETANHVTEYFHLKTINDELVERNVQLEMQLEMLSEALEEMSVDSTGLEQLKKEALKDCRLYKAKVIKNTSIVVVI